MAAKIVRQPLQNSRRLYILLVPLRRLSTTPTCYSGHNRWSKIKHEKGKADANKSKERSILSAELTRAARDHGGDPNSNPRLATLIASAKKTGFAKDSIENAIARGSGKTKDGKALENLSIEVMVPPSVGAIIECQTDNAARTLQEIRTIVKDSGARITPTKHLFERRGRIVVTKAKDLDEEAFFDIAVDAGATDIDVDDSGSPVLYTEPQLMSEVSEALLRSKHSLQIESAEIIWHPLEDAMTDNPGGDVIPRLLEQFDEIIGVQEIFLNIK